MKSRNLFQNIGTELSFKKQWMVKCQNHSQTLQLCNLHSPINQGTAHVTLWRFWHPTGADHSARPYGIWAFQRQLCQWDFLWHLWISHDLLGVFPMIFWSVLFTRQNCNHETFGFAAPRCCPVLLMSTPPSSQALSVLLKWPNESRCRVQSQGYRLCTYHSTWRSRKGLKRFEKVQKCHWSSDSLLMWELGLTKNSVEASRFCASSCPLRKAFCALRSRSWARNTFRRWPHDVETRGTPSRFVATA